MSTVLGQLYFDSSTNKWGQHKIDTVAALTPSKELVVLCLDVNFSNVESTAGLIEQYRPLFLCVKNMTRALYDTICGINIVRHNYAVCQHNAPQQCILFWHHTLNVDFVSIKNISHLSSTALSTRQMRGMRCDLTIVCAAPSTPNAHHIGHGIGAVLSDLPVAGQHPFAVIAVLPKGYDVRTALTQYDYDTHTASGDVQSSPFLLATRGCVCTTNVMALDMCGAVIFNGNLQTAAQRIAKVGRVTPTVNILQQKQKQIQHSQRDKGTHPSSLWSESRVLRLPRGMTPMELSLDITGMVSTLPDAVDALNGGRFPWPHDYAVWTRTSEGEPFPVFILVSTHGHCDLAKFCLYMSRVNYSKMSYANAVPRPTTRWNVNSAVLLTTLSPLEGAYDVSDVLPRTAVPYTLAQIVKKLNSNEFEWKRDFAVVHIEEGGRFYLLSSSNVPCNLSLARYEAVFIQEQGENANHYKTRNSLDHNGNPPGITYIIIIDDVKKRKKTNV